MVYHKLVLSSEVQRGAAGRQHFEAWGGRQQLSDQRCGGGHLLAVIEQKQQFLVAQVRRQFRHEWYFRARFNIQSSRDHVGDQRSGAGRSEIDEPGIVGERIAQLCRNLERQAGFAHATRAAQSQQADVGAWQERAYGGDFALAPDRAGARQGQQAGPWWRYRSCGRRVQSDRARLAQRYLQKAGALAGRQLQVLRQPLGDLGRGPPLIRLDLADGDLGAAD
jgi:hypothetical protein